MLDAAAPGSSAVPLPGDAMRALRLERPLVIFDTETTGTDPKFDRIVEFAGVKLHPDGRREVMRTLVDPKTPIPPEASRIHGITDEMVQGAPTLVETAADILKFLDGSDLAGYNVQRFDIPILQAELARAEMELPLEGVRVVDPQVIFFNREPRDLQAAVRWTCSRRSSSATPTCRRTSPDSRPDRATRATSATWMPIAASSGGTGKPASTSARCGEGRCGR
jgi:hypothetical protein